MSRTPEAPGLTKDDMEAPGLRRRLRTQAEAEKGEAEICFGSKIPSCRKLVIQLHLSAEAILYNRQVT